MSGGHFNYICYTIEDNLVGEMQDETMNEFVKDFAKLTHDLEWWLSADYGNWGRWNNWEIKKYGDIGR